MKRDYNEKCLEALELVYTKYGIDMNNAPIEKMINAITSELGCTIGYHIMFTKDAKPIDEKELVLNALEDDYLNEIGLRNILLA
jgi:hypothetical protein